MYKIYFINKLQISRILPRRFQLLTSSRHAVRFETAKVGLRERSKRTYRPQGILAFADTTIFQTVPPDRKETRVWAHSNFSHTLLQCIIRLQEQLQGELLSLENLSRRLMNLYAWCSKNQVFLSRIGSYLQRE